MPQVTVNLVPLEGEKDSSQWFHPRLLYRAFLSLICIEDHFCIIEIYIYYKIYFVTRYTLCSTHSSVFLSFFDYYYWLIFSTTLKEVRVTKMSVRPNYISSGFADFRQEEILEELIGQTDEIRADQLFHWSVKSRSENNLKEIFIMRLEILDPAPLSLSPPSVSFSHELPLTLTRLSPLLLITWPTLPTSSSSTLREWCSWWWPSSGSSAMSSSYSSSAAGGRVSRRSTVSWSASPTLTPSTSAAQGRVSIHV